MADNLRQTMLNMWIVKLRKGPLAQVHLLVVADIGESDMQQDVTIELTIPGCCDCHLEESANMI